MEPLLGEQMVGSMLVGMLGIASTFRLSCVSRSLSALCAPHLCESKRTCKVYYFAPKKPDQSKSQRRHVFLHIGECRVGAETALSVDVYAQDRQRLKATLRLHYRRGRLLGAWEDRCKLGKPSKCGVSPIHLNALLPMAMDPNYRLGGRALVGAAPGASVFTLLDRGVLPHLLSRWPEDRCSCAVMNVLVHTAELKNFVQACTAPPLTIADLEALSTSDTVDVYVPAGRVCDRGTLRKDEQWEYWTPMPLNPQQLLRHPLMLEWPTPSMSRSNWLTIDSRGYVSTTPGTTQHWSQFPKTTRIGWHGPMMRWSEIVEHGLLQE